MRYVGPRAGRGDGGGCEKTREGYRRMKGEKGYVRAAPSETANNDCRNRPAFSVWDAGSGLARGHFHFSCWTDRSLCKEGELLPHTCRARYPYCFKITLANITVGRFSSYQTSRDHPGQPFFPYRKSKRGGEYQARLALEVVP